MGSASLAAAIAQLAFWILIPYGWLTETLGIRTAAVFSVLWLIGLVGRSYVPLGDLLFTSYVAVLDVALVFIIFQGDVRIT